MKIFFLFFIFFVGSNSWSLQKNNLDKLLCESLYFNESQSTCLYEQQQAPTIFTLDDNLEMVAISLDQNDVEQAKLFLARAKKLLGVKQLSK